jgi:hypothetical protein
MTIRNAEHYMEGVWDWGILKGTLGGRIEPTDLDGFVERKGQFLVLETKQPGVGIPMGQRLTFEALVKMPQFTVVIIWGKKGEPQALQVWTAKGKQTYRHADLALLRRVVSAWYAWANAQAGADAVAQFHEAQRRRQNGEGN